MTEWLKNKALDSIEVTWFWFWIEVIKYFAVGCIKTWLIVEREKPRQIVQVIESCLLGKNAKDPETMGSLDFHVSRDLCCFHLLQDALLILY